jgi:hypothetical protein
MVRRQARAYIDGKNLPKKFYLLGNNPVNVAQQYPSALKSLHAVMNEVIFYSNSQFGGGAQSASQQNYISNLLAPIFNRSGLVIRCSPET